MIRPLRRVLSLTRGRGDAAQDGSRRKHAGASVDENPQRRIDEARRRLKATIPPPAEEP